MTKSNIYKDTARYIQDHAMVRPSYQAVLQFVREKRGMAEHTVLNGLTMEGHLLHDTLLKWWEERQR